MTAEPRPIVIRDALVHVTPSRTMQGDIVAQDGVLTQVGSAHELVPSGALVLNGAGASVVPILIDSAVRAQGAASGPELKTGHPAAFAAIRGAVSASRIGESLIVDPRDMLAVVLGNHVVNWGGVAAGPSDPGPAWVGAWTDARRGMTQFLTAEGRYSETRGGRVDAYTGRFWAHGEWIAYLDDTGFWAFGQEVDGVLYHGGFVLRRSRSGSAA